MDMDKRSIAFRPDVHEGEALQLAALQGAATALLADAFGAVRCVGEPIRNHGGKSHFVGEALTIAAGYLAQWKALDLARPGQVLVIATNSRRDLSEFGAIFVKLARAKGLAAIVTDGLLRDREEIRGIEIPVFACGSHPFSPADSNQGQIGFPIQFAGATVQTGDVIVGDADGLAIVPRESLAGLLERLERQRGREQALEAAANASTWALPRKILDAVSAIPLVDRPGDGERTGRKHSAHCD